MRNMEDRRKPKVEAEDIITSAFSFFLIDVSASKIYLKG